MHYRDGIYMEISRLNTLCGNISWLFTLYIFCLLMFNNLELCIYLSAPRFNELLFIIISLHRRNALCFQMNKTVITVFKYY